MKKINNCCICNENTENIYNIKFKEIIGMAEDYLQEINICKDCGFIFTANPFTEEQFKSRYSKMSKYEYDSSKNCIDEDKPYVNRSHRQYEFIKNSIGIVNSILEIGAATGYNLSLYENCGVKALGIEPSRENVNNAKVKYGIDMFCGMFNEYYENNFNEEFELVFLSHVLEHIVNPSKFIEKVKCINSKYIFIEVPSMDYKFIDEPLGMFCDEHVNYFTIESLVNLMNSQGYELIDLNLIFGIKEKIPAGYPVISSLWIRNNNNNNTTINVVNDSFNSIYRYITCSNEELKRIEEIIKGIENTCKVAVWGTGNHTSRLLGQTSLIDKNIIKFYDSDEKKHRFTMLGKEITKFNVEDVESGKVDTILISTYVSQEQIVSYINSLDLKCNIITLY